MRRLAASVGMTFALGATAFAADVAPRLRPAPVPYLAPWAGVYLGGFAGGHWSKDRWNSDETQPAGILGPFDLKVDGFTGGFVSGANMQHGNFVWGIETDIGFFTGSNNFGPLRTLFPGLGGAFADSIETELRYNAHARLRFGWSMGSWLPFVAAGVAYANTRTTFTDTQNDARPDTLSLTQDRVGYTIGGGVDWMVLPNWIARVEYLHDRYLTQAFGPQVRDEAEFLELNANIVRGALIYKFGAGAPEAASLGIFKAPPAAGAWSGGSWAGVYIGGFAGGHWSRDSWTSDETAPADILGPFNLDVDGFTGGGLIGANVQYGNHIWGVEADAGFLTGSKNFGPLDTLFPGLAGFDSIETKMRWNAHARIRKGYSFGSWMPFVATGVAYANTRMTLTDSAATPSQASISLDRVGFSSGGGVDWMFNPSWIARAEYIYDRYASAGFQTPVRIDSQFMALRSHIVRGAVMYKWGDDRAVPVSGGIYKAPAAPALAGWSGGYIGAFAGGHWSRDRWASDESFPVSDNGALDLKPEGGNFGGLIGANLQYGRAVWGIEADGGVLTGSDSHGGLLAQEPGLILDSIETKLHANAHGRLRFGYDAGHWLPFVAGGIAYASTRMTVTNPPRETPIQSIDLNRVGFTFGGGIDWRFTSSWIGRVEYLRDLYATASFSGSRTGTLVQHMELSSNIVRGALIYKLGGGPVVARY